MIGGCALLVFLVMSSCDQTSKKGTDGTQNSIKKIDKTKVPKVVTDAFTIEYAIPDSEFWYGYSAIDSSSDWYMYDPYLYVDNEYPETFVAGFSKDSIPYKSIYSKTGKKIATHKIVNNIPSAISDSISKSAYNTWTIEKDKEEIFKDSDNDQLKIYRVSVSKGSEKHTLYYDKAGKLVKDKKMS
jgi:hypothetical protein